MTTLIFKEGLRENSVALYYVKTNVFGGAITGFKKKLKETFKSFLKEEQYSTWQKSPFLIKGS